MMAGLDQSVEEIVRKHWQRFGRCYFQRRDYFIANESDAAAIMRNLTESIGDLANSSVRGTAITRANVFTYEDPIDGSVSTNQGIRIEFTDGGRVVIRLSGTGTSGATLRVYLDKIVKDPAGLDLDPDDALQDLATSAAEIARIEHFTGLSKPTAVI
jgi:phosphoglucomutase